MSDITWTGEHAAEWAEHYGGQVIDLDKARARTDAERLAAMGGHQVGNCDGCGVYHPVELLLRRERRDAGGSAARKARSACQTF